MPAISIIVPVYNTEKRLSQCIDSILAQTFVAFECILIDDGSTDKSSEICDEYALNDKRITVIHQQNAGPSAARNVGLDKAQGEWLGFVDSDDWIEPEMFQFLYENGIRNDADVSACGWRRIAADGKTVESVTLGCENVYDSTGAILAMFSGKAFEGYIWNKLIKAEYLKKYAIRYDKKIMPFEETLVVFEVFKHVQKVVYSPIPYYNYFINPVSLTNQSRLKWTGALPAFEKMLTMETNKAIREKIIERKVEMVSFVCYSEIENYKSGAYSIFKKIAMSNMFRILFCLPLPLKDRLSRCFCLASPKLYIFLQQRYRRLK